MVATIQLTYDSMLIGYSATIWDHGRSGIGNYIAEHLRLLSHREGIELRAIECGGRLLPAGEPPRKGSAGSGAARFFRPVADILWHRYGLKKMAADHHFDLVHVPTIRRIPGPLPCPSVLTVHDLGPVRMKRKYGLLRQFYHEHLIPRMLGSVSAIVTPSSYTRDDLIELYRADASKITVVANGVDHALFNPGEPEVSREFLRVNYKLTAPFFVYISRLEHPAKNHVPLIEAFGRFKSKTGLPHQLVLVGSRWNGYEAILAAAKRGIDDGSVFIAGHVPRQQLPHFLRASVAMVYPSLFEGFGLPVIEAMACGTPVACSRSSSLTEIAEGHGLLFDPNDPEQIQIALEKLATDETLRSELSRKGLAHAASFTWERSVEETIAVWRRTLGGRS